LVALPLAVAGCKTNPTAGFGDVQKTISARTGQQVEWPLAADQSEKADAAVRELVAKELTPEAAVQLALLNNRNLRATLQEIGISRAEVIQAGLPRNPEFAASVRFPDRPPSAANTEFSIAQDFLDLILLPLRKSIAQAQFEQTKARVAHETLQLVAEVKTAFYTIQAREQFIKRLEAIMAVNAAAVDLSTRQHNAGNITDLELATQQSAFQEAKLEWAKAQAQLRSDRERLNRLLGLWGENTRWKIADSLPPLPQKEVSFDHLESLAVEQRLDLAAARQQVALAARALTLRSNTRYLPTSIRIGVDTEREPDRQNVTGPTLDFEVPIFDHGQGDVAKLQAQYRQAQHRLDSLATDIRSRVRESRDSLISARDLTEFYKDIYLPQRIRILNETLLQYNAMQKGTFELINAKERELSAEREYIEAWRDYWIARAELENAVGGKLPSTQPAGTAATDSLAPSDREMATVSGSPSTMPSEHEHKH
jgi:cobalt-zinc-cadmium efflux system outer membrane protein